MLSHFSSVRLFVTIWTIAHQARLAMGFSRQEYWSGLSCPPPWHLSDPGIEPLSLESPALAGRFFTTSTTEKPWHSWLLTPRAKSSYLESVWSSLTLLKVSTFSGQFLSLKWYFLSSAKDRNFRCIWGKEGESEGDGIFEVGLPMVQRSHCLKTCLFTPRRNTSGLRKTSPQEDTWNDFCQ